MRMPPAMASTRKRGRFRRKERRQFARVQGGEQQHPRAGGLAGGELIGQVDADDSAQQHHDQLQQEHHAALSPPRREVEHKSHREHRQAMEMASRHRQAARPITWPVAMMAQTRNVRARVWSGRIAETPARARP